jgi:dephospho-CoA kinase
MLGRVVGIAGYTGSGKSLAAALLAKNGFAVIDADREAKKAMQESDTVKKALAARFGIEVIAGQVIDSRLLGERVFANAGELADFNAIVHPPVLRYLNNLVFDCRRNGDVALDAALIPLWRNEAWFDALIWVAAPRAVRLARLCARPGTDQAAAARRMQLQEALFTEPEEPPWCRIDNAGTQESFSTAVKQWLLRFKNNGERQP